MEKFTQRFDEQKGGLYQFEAIKQNTIKDQDGGRRKKKLSPCSKNWKKKYLEMKLERDNLKKENKVLKKKLQSNP